MNAAPIPDVRCYSVGPIQENAYFVRASAGAASALLVDPGEEPQRLLDAARALGVTVEAILITHCHFDHIGAVAPVARATGAPVYCPEIETGVLADIMKWTMPGFGPFESWQAEQTVAGDEHLRLAGMDVEVFFTPGHSPGHVTYAIANPAEAASAGERASDEQTPAAGSGEGASDRQAFGAGPAERGPAGATRSDGPGAVTGDAGADAGADAPHPVLLSGDVLFQGSVGRVDLPGGDWVTLERSIAELMRRFPRETAVYPGHMGATTLGREWDANPFLAELRAATSAADAPLRAG